MNSPEPVSDAVSDSLWEEYDQIDVADIVVDIDAPDLKSTYTYRVPESMQNLLKTGECVHVSFAGREALGYVIERRRLAQSDPLVPKLKLIQAIVEDAVTINEEQLQLIRWMCGYYLCDLLSALRCVAPATLGAQITTRVTLKDPSIRSEDVGNSLGQAHLVEILRSLGDSADLDELRDAANLPGFSTALSALVKKGIFLESTAVARPRSVHKTIKAYSLGSTFEVMGTEGMGRRSPQQQKLLDSLLELTRLENRPIPRDRLLAHSGVSAASLKSLEQKGLIQSTELKVRRAPMSAVTERTCPPRLSAEQQKACTALRRLISSHELNTVLLFGVTASGKTEVYLDAISCALNDGRTAIVLVPEIALTAQVADVFVGRFGDQVAVLHSRLSDGERHDEWKRVQSGEAKIVVGARSAIFAPVTNVGLIVMDEEHESSYKQEKNPRYHARDLAVERARICGATLLLGSATPSLESYYAADLYLSVEQHLETIQGADQPDVQFPSQLPAPVRRLEMLERIDNRPLAKVEVIDLREEFKQRKALFSQRLTEAISERLEKKQQTILFLNRRGYAQFILCRDCGYVARCPHCAVTVAFHVYDQSLRCHHCGHFYPAPKICPDCHGERVRAFGIGTEKVEEETLRLFPEARISRMDRDTTSRKGEHHRILKSFRMGDADILIGTQMVAKGLDFPNVTLVGVISADTAINMPDFRAAERTFQILTQVAGRAGRGKLPGEVIVQTFSPDHYAVVCAAQQDYPAFFQQELLFRKELMYPPFSRFVNLICSDSHGPVAEDRAERLAQVLKPILPPEVELIGPSPAPLARLKNLFRYHLALRSPYGVPLSQLLQQALAQLTPAERMGLTIDLDPLNMS